MKKLGKVFIGVGFAAIGVPLFIAILYVLAFSFFGKQTPSIIHSFSFLRLIFFRVPNMFYFWLGYLKRFSEFTILDIDYLSNFLFLFLPNVFIIAGFTILINQSQKIAIQKCFNMLVIIGLALNILVVLKFFGLYNFATRYNSMGFFLSIEESPLRIYYPVFLLILNIIPVLPTFIITAGYSKFFEKEASIVVNKSYFDGGLLSLIGWILLGILVTVCSLGICFPWAFCMVYGWKARHTMIDGKRLQFSGTALSLFGHWILWFFLTIITFGIFGWWLSIALKKWIVKHTSFVESENKESYFDGGLLTIIGWKILGFLVTVITFGICYPWAFCMIYGWEARHSVIEGKREKFHGKALALFGHWVLWLFLTIITYGIFAFWVAIFLEKWKVKNTTFEEVTH